MPTHARSSVKAEYRGLHKYLRDRFADTVVLTFGEIEELLGVPPREAVSGKLASACLISGVSRFNRYQAHARNEESSLSDRFISHVLSRNVETTRSLVDFFMNNFRKQGFIEYKSGARLTSLF